MQPLCVTWYTVIPYSTFIQLGTCEETQKQEEESIAYMLKKRYSIDETRVFDLEYVLAQICYQEDGSETCFPASKRWKDLVHK